MSNDLFGLLERALEAGDAEPAFEQLAASFREQKNYPLLFECRLMQKRLELGLPLIPTDPDAEPSAELRRKYEAAMMEAARETGSLYLGEGDIVRAWPYYRALGEHEAIAGAIEKIEPADDIDGVIAIAFQERVNPRKGFELILRQYGMCRAITFFEQYPVRQGRQESLALLVRTLYGDLVESLRRTISQAEGKEPEQYTIRDLIAGRDWLFGEYDYYVDTSHLVSVLRFAVDLEDRELLRKTVELAEYGRQLSPMFHFRGEPPFENTYDDYGVYLRALAEESADEATAHFRAKLAGDGDLTAAQVLVLLLARLKRYDEAIELSLEYLRDVPPSQLGCPSVTQLCQLARDFRRLKEVARQRQDVLAYAAALVQSR